MGAYNIESFRWSESDYSLKEFIERFGHQLPCLISVTEGHMGQEEWLPEIPNSEVSWLHAIAKQARVVLKDGDEHFYSLPETYKGLVIPVTSSGQEGSPMPVAQVLMANYRFLRFVDNGRKAVFDGCDFGRKTKLGQLEIVDRYDERFLIVYVMIQGRLYPDFAVIPLYVPIKVSIAMTSATGGQKAFFTSMLEFKNFADDHPHDYTPALETFAQITVFEGKPDLGDYDYISVLPLNHAEKLKRPKKECEQTPAKPVYRDSHIAFGIHPEDRLRQLKHILYNKKIPDDDTDEGVPPASTTVDAKNKAKSRPKNKSESKSKQLLAALMKFRNPKKERNDDSSSSYESLNRHGKTDNGYDSLVKTSPLPTKGTRQSGSTKPLPKQPQVSAETQFTPPIVPSKALFTPPIVPSKALFTPPIVPSKALFTPPIVPSKALFTPPIVPSKALFTPPIVPSKARITTKFQSIADIPSDLSPLSIDDVGTCLDLLHMTQYTSVLRDQLVDGQMLMSLDESLLKDEFGFSNFEAKKLVMFAQGYRPKIN